MNIPIRVKTLLFVGVLGPMLISAGAGLGYFWGYNLLQDTIGADYVKMATLLSESLNRIITEEIKDLQTYMSSPERIRVIKNRNTAYEKMSDEEIKARFMYIDSEWPKISPTHSLFEEYLNTPTSNRLKEIQTKDSGIAEIFMTDMYGGLVASSGKTTDFYQADEKWWQEAFNDGKGKLVFSDAEFDESSQTVSLALAIPIRDRSEKVIGVSKAVLDIHRIFSPLKNFNIEKTGHALLIDSDGYIIFHGGITPLSLRFLEEKDVKRIFSSKKHWMVIEDSKIHYKDIFVAAANIKHPELLNNRIFWKICVAQDAKEVFLPLKKLMYQFILIVGILLVMLIILGIMFSRIFTNPINKLQIGVERMAKGNLNYKVRINTGDEIEKLADTFNFMTDNLKKTTTSIENLNKEIEERKKIESALNVVIESTAKKTGQEFFDNLVRIIAEWLKMDIVIVGQIVNGECISALSMYKNGKIVHDYSYNLKNTPCENVAEKGYCTHMQSVAQLFPKDKDLRELGSEGYVGIPLKKVSGRTIGILCALSRSRLTLPEQTEQVIRTVAARLAVEIERKNAEEKAERATREWQRTFDSITDFVFILDNNFTIVKANKSFIGALKAKLEDVIGKKCYELFHKSDKPWPHCPFEMTKEDNKPHIQEVDDSNIGIPLLVSVSPIFDTEGKLVGVVHIARDITERKKTENILKQNKEELEAQTRQLKKSNEDIKSLYGELEKSNAELKKIDQLKSDFVSTVSHELRTPLSITKEGISLVLDKIAGSVNAKQKKILNTAKDNIDRLARIINDLLDISKIEAGKVELKKEKIDLKKLLEQLRILFQEKAKKENLKFNINIPKKNMKLFADPDKLKQVFINLIDNSIRFTQKGYVEVFVRELKDVLEFSVTDTGKGISGKDLPKIFNKFQQFGRIAGPGEKGTGLGLAIVKGIVELHSGRVWAESKLGRGTKFTFTLPMYSSDRFFKDYLKDSIKDAKREDYKLSILIIGIADYEKLKEKSSPEKTQEILKCLETSLKKTLRKKGDIIAKDTGEVMVILNNCNKENALKIEGRLEGSLEECQKQHKMKEEIRIHFGCATFPDDAKTEEDLIKIAKSA